MLLFVNIRFYGTYHVMNGRFLVIIYDTLRHDMPKRYNLLKTGYMLQRSRDGLSFGREDLLSVRAD